MADHPHEVERAGHRSEAGEPPQDQIDVTAVSGGGPILQKVDPRSDASPEQGCGKGDGEVIVAPLILQVGVRAGHLDGDRSSAKPCWHWRRLHRRSRNLAWLPHRVSLVGPISVVGSIPTRHNSVLSIKLRIVRTDRTFPAIVKQCAIGIHVLVSSGRLPLVVDDDRIGHIAKHAPAPPNSQAEIDILLPIQIERIKTAGVGEVFGPHRHASRCNRGIVSALLAWGESPRLPGVERIPQRGVLLEHHAHALNGTIWKEQLWLSPLDAEVLEGTHKGAEPFGSNFGVVVEKHDTRTSRLRESDIVTQCKTVVFRIPHKPYPGVCRNEVLDLLDRLRVAAILDKDHLKRLARFMPVERLDAESGQVGLFIIADDDRHELLVAVGEAVIHAFPIDQMLASHHVDIREALSVANSREACAVGVVTADEIGKTDRVAGGVSQDEVPIDHSLESGIEPAQLGVELAPVYEDVEVDKVPHP